MYGDRLNDDDWKALKKYWLSEESQARTRQAKANRAKLTIHHTSGSRSFACSGHKMAIELGRPARRDELYIKTHTRKNGVPLQPAEPIINKLQSIVEEHPELTQRTIQEGDAFAAACGEKEPKGRVRVLGLGPTPQSVGTPGVKSYTPTRIQAEVLARRNAEDEKAALRQRIAELEEKLLEHERSNMENISQNGSNSRHQVSPRSENDGVGPNLDAEFHEDERYAEPQSSPMSAAPFMQPRPFTTTSGAPSQQPYRRQSSHVHADTLAQQPPQSTMRAATVVQPCPGISTSAAPSVQPSRCHSNNVHVQQPQPRPGISTSAAPLVQPSRCQSNNVHVQQPQPRPSIHTRNDDTNHFSHDEYIGKEVILYPNMKSDQPVAKGVVISTNPSTVLAGQALGRQYCEVVVRVVMKRDAMLPRPYVGVEKMADAKHLSIAWPYNWLKLSKTSKSFHDTGGRKVV